MHELECFSFESVAERHATKYFGTARRFDGESKGVPDLRSNFGRCLSTTGAAYYLSIASAPRSPIVPATAEAEYRASGKTVQESTSRALLTQGRHGPKAKKILDTAQNATEWRQCRIRIDKPKGREKNGWLSFACLGLEKVADDLQVRMRITGQQVPSAHLSHRNGLSWGCP